MTNKALSSSYPLTNLSSTVSGMWGELFLFLVLKKVIECKFIQVCKRKTNKEKSTEIFPPLLFKPLYRWSFALPRAKKGQKKVSNFKENDKALPL